MTTLPTLLAELRRRVASARKYTPKTHADGDGITTVPTVMVDELLTHIDALEVDARRYRWLKAWGNTGGWEDDAIDRQIAIDAALAEQGEPK